MISVVGSWLSLLSIAVINLVGKALYYTSIERVLISSGVKNCYKLLRCPPSPSQGSTPIQIRHQSNNTQLLKVNSFAGDVQSKLLDWGNTGSWCNNEEHATKRYELKRCATIEGNCSSFLMLSNWSC